MNQKSYVSNKISGNMAINFRFSLVVQQMYFIHSGESFIEYILFFWFTTLKAVKTESSVVNNILEFVNSFKILTILTFP